VKIGLMLGLILAAAAAIGVALAVVVVAWVKGGVQPAQTVEIPVDAATPGKGGRA
jgi:hypothetical protein